MEVVLLVKGADDVMQKLAADPQSFPEDAFPADFPPAEWSQDVTSKTHENMWRHVTVCVLDKGNVRH